MHWILQLGLEAGHAEEAIIQALQELELPHSCVNVVPFSHELNPDPGEPEGKVVVYGGTVLRRIAQSRSWSPGYYWNDANFDFRAWKTHWGEHLLNADSVVAHLEDVDEIDEHIFIRPTTSDKVFTGGVFSWDEFVVWRDGILSGRADQDSADARADTLVAYAPAKYIDQECRFFVADSKIAAASFYRLSAWEQFSSVHTRVPFYGTPWYDPTMEQFVLGRIAEWQPHKAFVMDIARVDDSYKIIEINAYNSSGIYECDPKRIISAVEEMENEIEV